MSGEHQISIWAWHWWTWNLCLISLSLSFSVPSNFICIWHYDKVVWCLISFHLNIDHAWVLRQDVACCKSHLQISIILFINICFPKIISFLQPLQLPHAHDQWVSAQAPERLALTFSLTTPGWPETHLEGESDGLGDAGEVDQDGGTHFVAQSQNSNNIRVKQKVVTKYPFLWPSLGAEYYSMNRGCKRLHEYKLTQGWKGFWSTFRTFLQSIRSDVQLLCKISCQYHKFICLLLIVDDNWKEPTDPVFVFLFCKN